MPVAELNRCDSPAKPGAETVTAGVGEGEKLFASGGMGRWKLGPTEQPIKAATNSKQTVGRVSLLADVFFAEDIMRIT
jgi:hypothetical protein